MKAIILAAGCGRRMENLTSNFPKAMLPLHGRPLIEWQMEALRRAGVSEIAIVKGYCGEVFTYPVTYFENPLWAKTNMFYTLFCADYWLSNFECVVSYSDIVYYSNIIEVLIEEKSEIAITSDLNWRQLWEKRFTNPLSDAEIFKFDHCVLRDIGGRANSLDEIQGQYMGLLKFNPAGWKKAKAFAMKNDGDIYNFDMTALLKVLLKENVLIGVVESKSTWCEIDTANDYLLCQTIMNPSEKDNM